MPKKQITVVFEDWIDMVKKPGQTDEDEYKKWLTRTLEGVRDIVIERIDIERKEV